VGGVGRRAPKGEAAIADAQRISLPKNVSEARRLYNAGKYAEALSLQRTLTFAIEKAETAKIGKPEGIGDAKRILRRLSGETHRIFTSVAILDGLGGPGLKIVHEVIVMMRDYSQEEIERYLLCNESLDKAGGYSIQGKGKASIESIRGDYLAAVGLPLKPIADYLRSRGVQGLTNVDKLYSDKSYLNWKTFD